MFLYSFYSHVSVDYKGSQNNVKPMGLLLIKQEKQCLLRVRTEIKMACLT